MNRRALLATLPLALAGCNAPGAGSNAASTADRQETDTRQVTDDRMLIRVHNATETESAVTLTLTRAGTTVFEERVTVGVAEQTTVDPDIDQQGDYILTVETDGGETGRLPFDVGDYERRMGSDLLVEVGTEQVRVLIEE